MPAPGWLRWTLAVAMIAVALYHLSRLAKSRWQPSGRHGAHTHVDVELTHAAMGSVMTLMVLDALSPDDLRGLGLIFLAPTLWFVSRAVYSYVMHGPRGVDVAARQMIGCAAMAYMLLVLAAPSARPGVTGTVTGAMSAMPMSGASTSALGTLSSPAFRVFVVGATVGMCGWTIARIRAPSADAGPALGLGCQLAVSVTTIYMLLAM
jgi:hypothetical protein